jgi:hypothetical protein
MRICDKTREREMGGEVYSRERGRQVLLSQRNSM